VTQVVERAEGITFRITEPDSIIPKRLSRSCSRKVKRQKLYEREQNTEIKRCSANGRKKCCVKTLKERMGLIEVLEVKKCPKEYRKPKWRLSK
jgi:hypothetical protein